MPIKFLTSLLELFRKPQNQNILTEIALYANLRNKQTDQIVIPTDRELNLLGVTEFQIKITRHIPAPIAGIKGYPVQLNVEVRLIGNDRYPLKLMIRIPRVPIPIVMYAKAKPAVPDIDVPYADYYSHYFTASNGVMFSGTLEIHALVD